MRALSCRVCVRERAWLLMSARIWTANGVRRLFARSSRASAEKKPLVPFIRNILPIGDELAHFSRFQSARSRESRRSPPPPPPPPPYMSLYVWERGDWKFPLRAHARLRVSYLAFFLRIYTGEKRICLSHGLAAARAITGLELPDLSPFDSAPVSSASPA